MGALAAGAAVGVPPLPLAGDALARADAGARDAAAFMARAARNRAGWQAAEPAELTVAEAGTLLRSGDLSPSELVADCLARIDRWDAVYQAFNAVPEDAVRARARELDGTAPRGPLHGIPLAIKDNFYTRGLATTANSRIFEGFEPEYDATAVARLVAAGALVLGKTQMGPLATTRALTPEGDVTTLNAWATHDADVSPGGSSSGTATAVAARMAPGGTGTQTGGSITSPSLAQGLTGLKPTLGRVSLRGVIPLSYTRDHAGPIARDAADVALLLQVMAGPDAEDPRTLGLPPVPDYLAAATPMERTGGITLRWPTRVGVPGGWLAAGDDALRPGREAFLDSLEGMGAQLVEITYPDEWEALTSSAMNAVRLPERSEIFLDALRRDVRLFGVALSPWINGLLLSGDELLKGQRARLALLRLVLETIFRDCDVLLQTGSGPMDMIGLPLVAFPIGMRERSGVLTPHGALVAAPPLGEERLLSVAAAWQAVTDWHLQRPPRLPDEEQASRDGLSRPPARRLGVEAVSELAE
jgi:Asp-tRNA(Asn)/Glu-tRNA(Gln) amidotransferase A subunit family amidase